MMTCILFTSPPLPTSGACPWLPRFLLDAPAESPLAATHLRRSLNGHISAHCGQEGWVQSPAALQGIPSFQSVGPCVGRTGRHGLHCCLLRASASARLRQVAPCRLMTWIDEAWTHALGKLRDKACPLEADAGCLSHPSSAMRSTLAAQLLHAPALLALAAWIAFSGSRRLSTLPMPGQVHRIVQ